MNRILILGEQRSNLSGLEYRLVKLIKFLEDNDYTVDLYIAKARRKDVDKLVINNDWLKNIKYRYLDSCLYNKKGRIYYNALKLALYIKKYEPTHVISIDTATCYSLFLAKRIVNSNTPLYVLPYLPLDIMYRSEYTLHADYFLCISEDMVDYYKDKGISEDKICLVKNSVIRVDEIIERPKKCTFLYVGRLESKQKNLAEMFYALEKCSKDYTLHIVGAGPEALYLRKLANDTNIYNNIVWHGWQQEPWEYIKTNIKEVTALLSTSNYEGLNSSLLEAMSYGIYCISSDCCNSKYNIKENINGELYSLHNVDELANCLQSLIDGKDLPEAKVIKNSIEDCYENNYVKNLLTFLHKTGLKDD